MKLHCCKGSHRWYPSGGIQSRSGFAISRIPRYQAVASDRAPPPARRVGSFASPSAASSSAWKPGPGGQCGALFAASRRLSDLAAERLAVAAQLTGKRRLRRRGKWPPALACSLAIATRRRARAAFRAESRPARCFRKRPVAAWEGCPGPGLDCLQALRPRLACNWQPGAWAVLLIA